jgi:hypothetical protein
VRVPVAAWVPPAWGQVAVWVLPARDHPARVPPVRVPPVRVPPVRVRPVQVHRVRGVPVRTWSQAGASRAPVHRSSPVRWTMRPDPAATPASRLGRPTRRAGPRCLDAWGRVRWRTCPTAALTRAPQGSVSAHLPARATAHTRCSSRPRPHPCTRDRCIEPSGPFLLALTADQCRLVVPARRCGWHLRTYAPRPTRAHMCASRDGGAKSRPLW